MKSSSWTALTGLAFAIVACLPLVSGKEILGYVFLLASVINIAASHICTAIEKGSQTK